MKTTLKNKARLYLQLIRWDRPAGWLLLLWPTLIALWWAAGGFPGWHLTVVFVLGTILMRSAGCCINDIADRDFDKHVTRTQSRPVTTGAVSVKEALLVGAALAALAFSLVLSTNLLTIALSFLALLVTIVYPFSKRFFSMPQAVLGVAFSFGIPMAFAAVQGAVPSVALGLMLSNAFWVLAYDTEYAMVDREDDLKIGIRTSAITLGAWDVRAVMTFYFAHLGVFAYLAWRGGLHAVFYLALFLGLMQVAYHFYLIRKREPQACFKAFRINHWLGLTLFIGVVFSFAAHGL